MKKTHSNNLLNYGILIIIAVIISLFHFHGTEETWELWNIPTLNPEFADLRTITGGAESKEMGYDPMKENPGDPWNRPMNYPRIWQALYWFGINEDNTFTFGIVLIFLFVAGLMLFFKRRGILPENILMLLAIFSPAVMLTVERGNIDMLMFFLISISVFLIRKETSYSRVAAFISILIAFVLKLYPVFAILIFLKEKKEIFIKYLITIFFLGFIYAIATYSDLILIFENTPRDAYLSYGLDVLWTFFYRQNETLGIVAELLSYLLFILMMIFSLINFYMQGTIKKIENTRAIHGFRAGAAIFIFTFLLGNNFDYRLVFLLFVLPQVFTFLKSPVKSLSRISLIIVICIFISLWHLVISRIMLNMGISLKYSIAIDEAANWLVFLGLIYLFINTLPDWLRGNQKKVDVHKNEDY